MRSLSTWACSLASDETLASGRGFYEPRHVRAHTLGFMQLGRQWLGCRRQPIYWGEEGSRVTQSRVTQGSRECEGRGGGVVHSVD